MSVTPNSIGLVENPSIPGTWNFYSDPTYAWADIGAEPQYKTDVAIGVDPSTGLGGKWFYKDIYDKIGWLKRYTASSVGRGYQGVNILNNSAALTPADLGYLIQVINETPAETIGGVTITAGGSSYTSVPGVSFTGGGGSGAVGTATIVGGVVTGVTITNPGSGYTSAPTVSFSGGGGSGAAGTAVVTATPVVALTLPSRADLMTWGVQAGTITSSAPWVTAGGGVIPPIIIEGYTSSNGTPLSITVDNTTTTSLDYPQSVGFEGDTNHVFQTVYLYSGEYAELIPMIYLFGTYYLLSWVVMVHQSGYGVATNYVVTPLGVLVDGTVKAPKLIKADGSAINRALFPRLWQYVNSQPFSGSGLVAQGSKTNGVYGTGDGSSTFTLPDLTGVADAALIQYNIIY